MVRRDVAGAHLARATTWLDDSERLFGQPPAEFVKAAKDRDLAIFYLFLAIHECVDLAAHWVADEGWSPPDDAGSTFDVLASRDAIDRDAAEQLRLAAFLCNRIVHGYALLDYRRVQTEANAGIPALRGFLALVAREAGL